MKIVKVRGKTKSTCADGSIKRVSSSSFIMSYLKDESNIGGGSAEEVVLPTNEREVSLVMEKAFQNNKRVTVSGGGTGLTGARIPNGGIVLAMDNFTMVSGEVSENESILEKTVGGKTYSIKIGIDKETGDTYGVFPPGIPINILIDLISRRGLIYPPNPTEKNAFVGGNVATNSSGSWTYIYAPIRSFVIRLRIVLPNGDILEIGRGEYNITRSFQLILSGGETIDVELPSYKMPALKKHSAGYYIMEDMDLVDLFIGSEGTLGVFTEIELKLLPKPESILPVYAHFRNIWDLMGFVFDLKRYRGLESAKVMSIEFFDEHSVDFIRMKYPPPLIPEESRGIIFFEIGGEEGDVLSSLEEINSILDSHNVLRVMASEDIHWEEKAREMRHSVPEGVSAFVRRYGTHKVSTDIAVPADEFSDMMEDYIRVGEDSGIRYVMYGHIGDSHIHFNFLPKDSGELRRSLEYWVDLMKVGVKRGGTISAEHGVGKKRYLEDGEWEPIIKLMYGEKGLFEMGRLKASIDQRRILNIGNIVTEKYMDNC
jgi:D-lactate dehydrogenase (cytochrome)